MTTSKRKLSFSIVAIALIAVLVVGCGSDDSLTKAEFIQQGDVICQKVEKEKQVAIEETLAKAGVTPGNPMSAKEQENFVAEAILPPIRKAIDELNELGVPDEAQAEAIMEGAEEVVSDAEGDPSIISSAKDDPFTPTAAKARKYGFKTCFVYY
jgi:hypothetical protein